MLDFSAIDAKFLTRFLFAFVAYWLWGIINEGILKKIQAGQGADLVSFTNRKAEKLQQYADQTCTKIDVFFADHLSGATGKLNTIINRGDIPQPDRQLHRQLVAERYRFSLLCEKLGLGDVSD